MVPVVQLVRASDCGSECRRFESVRAPKEDIAERQCLFFVSNPHNFKLNPCKSNTYSDLIFQNTQSCAAFELFFFKN